MKTLSIVALDRDTLADKPFDFDFKFKLAEYGNTEPNNTAERLQGAQVVITNKVVVDAGHIAANPQLKLIAVAATG
ncbi:D-2-hydroxyacid dehydrogenase, partial [Bacillus stratosphericus]